MYWLAEVLNCVRVCSIFGIELSSKRIFLNNENFAVFICKCVKKRRKKDGEYIKVVRVFVYFVALYEESYFWKKKKRNSYTTQAMGQVFEAYARGANNQTPALFYIRYFLSLSLSLFIYTILNVIRQWIFIV